MKIHANSILFNDAERQELKALIDNKYGKVSNSSDYESTGGLHDMGIEGDIYLKTGEMISGSTLERMVGLTTEKRRSNMTTLSKLAKYLDFSSAEKLTRFISRKAMSSKDYSNDNFDFSHLYMAHNIQCTFNDQMSIEFKYLAENVVEVIRAEHSVLMQKDKLFITQLAIGEPLLARQLIREKGSNKHELGPYSSGYNHPVLKISLINRGID